MQQKIEEGVIKKIGDLEGREISKKPEIPAEMMVMGRARGKDDDDVAEVEEEGKRNGTEVVVDPLIVNVTS